LDGSFGNGGKLVTPIGTLNDEAFALTLQTDGRIVVAGWTEKSYEYNYALVRYNQDGTLDSSFNTNGIVITDVSPGRNDQALAVTMQTDGKIVAAGNASFAGAGYDFSLVRYHTNGTVDSTLGTNGIIITDFGTSQDVVRSVLIQPDKKILAGGYMNNGTNADFALARYLSEPCSPISLSFTLSVPNPVTNKGAARVLATNGEPPYLYSLDGLTFQTSNTFTSLDIGIYQVYVTDNNGCPGQGIFTIDESNCNCGNR
jgi:uncharacterized delta-60 repeat protein